MTILAAVRRRKSRWCIAFQPTGPAERDRGRSVARLARLLRPRHRVCFKGTRPRRLTCPPRSCGQEVGATDTDEDLQMPRANRTLHVTPVVAAAAFASPASQPVSHIQAASLTPPPPRLLRPRTVCERTGLSRTTLWRLERRGEFPRHRQISTNAVGWLEEEVTIWIQARAAK